MDKKRSYTESQRQQLCEEYLSGKQSRKGFCKKHDISPKSLSRWLLKKEQKVREAKFTPIGKLTAVANGLSLVAVNLPNGISIKFQLEAEKLQHLVKGLL